MIAFTDEAPNDGVVCSMSMSPDLMRAMEKVILEMHVTADGAALLRDVFHAEKFEPAPRLGYRSLYRVALATLQRAGPFSCTFLWDTVTGKIDVVPGWQTRSPTRDRTLDGSMRLAA